MSEIPPEIPSSAAQAGFQAREVAKEREARRAGQANAASRQVKTVDEAGATVETNDQDVAVFADAEGGGGEGRESEQPKAEQATEEADDAADRGIVRDDDGHLHLDIEA